MKPVLHGYRYSVYTWAARFALAAVEVDYRYHEVNPFDEPDPAYLALNPFQRVPTFEHDGSIIYETAVINRYVDERFNAGRLQRGTPLERARMNQIIAIVDADGYWPMVRLVFSHGFFRELEDEIPDQAELADGLARSQTVLCAIEAMLQPGRVVSMASLTLADLHLGPMVDYFCRVEAGRDMLSQFPQLNQWYEELSRLPAFQSTMPSLTI